MGFCPAEVVEESPCAVAHGLWMVRAFPQTEFVLWCSWVWRWILCGMDTSFEIAVKEWLQIADTLRTHAHQTSNLQGVAWHSISADAFKRDVEARATDFHTAANLAENVSHALAVHGQAVETVSKVVLGR